jgi:hypothetical protein
MNTTINVKPLYDALGIHVNKDILIDLSSNMSGLESPPTQDWLFLGLYAMREIAQRRNPKHVAIIGSGNGIDAIGYLHFSRPQSMQITDLLDEPILEIIRRNIENNAQLPRDGVKYSSGRDAEPLTGQSDLIYANLPLIMTLPEDIRPDRATTTLTRADAYIHLAQGESDPLLMYSLLSQLGFLQSAKQKLSNNGSIVTLIGGRVPFSTIEQCFDRAELEHRMIASIVKRQADPEFLKEYAEYERKMESLFGSEPFTFYDEQHAIRLLKSRNISYGQITQCSDDELKLLLQSARITAQKAYQMHLAGMNVSHIGYAFEARQRT